MLWKIKVFVFIAGCIGGAVTGLVAEASSSDMGPRRKRLGIAYQNPGCKTVFAGLAGHVLLGGIAAVVYWGFYGPFSGFAILGTAPHGTNTIEPFLTIGQLVASIVLGIGGPAFLQAEVQLRCQERFRQQFMANGVQESLASLWPAN